MSFRTALRVIGRGEVQAVSLKVTAESILHGYRQGRFPWPRPELGGLIPWFSPDPRAVMYPTKVRMSRDVRRIARRQNWTTTANAAFDQVVAGCASRKRTWIDDRILPAYAELHRMGHTFSVEVWDEEDRLVGGLYGIQVGGVFTGESMFHAVDHASKVAYAELARRMYACGATLVDGQYPTLHLMSLGAEEISRRDFRVLLDSVKDDPVRLPEDRRPVSALLEFRESVRAE